MNTFHYLLAALLSASALTASAQKLVGGDISLLPSYEEKGAKYSDHSGNAIPSLLPYLHQCQQRSGMTLMTYFEDHIYTEHPDDPYVLQSSRNNKMAVIGVEDFLRDTPRPLNKCLMVGPPALVPQWEGIMQRETEGRMHICRSTPYFIELLPIGIDKGLALKQLLPRLGMTTANLMAFGDSYNDITMLQAAGLGVAMGNAEEAVKAVADYVTDSNEADGVATALRHFNIL